MIDVDSMTEDELEEFIQETLTEAANSNSWHVSDRPIEFTISLLPRQLIAIERNARQAGKTRDEYIADTLSRELATA